MFFIAYKNNVPVIKQINQNYAVYIDSFDSKEEAVSNSIFIVLNRIHDIENGRSTFFKIQSIKKQMETKKELYLCLHNLLILVQKLKTSSKL